MTRRVFLHIGAMKTGTTYLQKVMLRNREALADAGVLFPVGPGGWRLQVDGVRYLTGANAGETTRLHERAWENLRWQLLDHPATSVVSMEFLSFADVATAGEFVSRLDGAEVHVVLGLRDTSRIVPALWQESARNHGIQPWHRFLADLTAEPVDRSTRAWKRFLRGQDVPRMLEAWLAHVPAERLTVVTVPPRGSAPDLLWRRFAGVVGLDPAVASDLPTPANESLGHASAELARRVNQAIGDDRSRSVHRASTAVLAKTVLVRRNQDEEPVRGDASLREFGARWNRVVRDAVVEAGVHVAGDLDDLPVVPGDGPAEVSRPTRQELLAAAAFAVAGLRAEIGAAGGTFAGPDDWSDEPEPVKAAVRTVVDAVRTLAEVKDAEQG
ncbi:MAG TPA: hypothetical protein VFK52_09410 [Nocardioidaceae bacterium]|nr:hypothetical protein [Nocardioidaceae bacterium]